MTNPKFLPEKARGAKSDTKLLQRKYAFSSFVGVLSWLFLVFAAWDLSGRVAFLWAVIFGISVFVFEVLLEQYETMSPLVKRALSVAMIALIALFALVAALPNQKPASFFDYKSYSDTYVDSAGPFGSSNFGILLDPSDDDDHDPSGPSSLENFCDMRGGIHRGFMIYGTVAPRDHRMGPELSSLDTGMALDEFKRVLCADPALLRDAEMYDRYGFDFTESAEARSAAIAEIKHGPSDNWSRRAAEVFMSMNASDKNIVFTTAPVETWGHTRGLTRYDTPNLVKGVHVRPETALFTYTSPLHGGRRVFSLSDGGAPAQMPAS